MVKVVMEGESGCGSNSSY